MKLKQNVRTLHIVGRADRCSSLKCNVLLSVGAPRVQGSVIVKPLKISAFKGSAQHDESGGRTSKSKSSKNPVKLSYVPQESEETINNSSELQNVPLSYTSPENESIAGSPAIQKLFKRWLTLLRTQSPEGAVNVILGEQQSLTKISVSQNGSQNQIRGEILKAVWCSFLGLDATVKIPLLIFVPFYLAVNIVYGAEVSKDLTPMWIFGPLIVALYIKIFKAICAVYVFTFKQTVQLVQNLPTYYLVAYTYIGHGKLKQDIIARLWHPVVNINFKELSKRKKKQVEEWALEKYLDYVESIWPYYCRTIRFLKRANLI